MWAFTLRLFHNFKSISWFNIDLVLRLELLTNKAWDNSWTNAFIKDCWIVNINSPFVIKDFTEYRLIIGVVIIKTKFYLIQGIVIIKMITSIVWTCTTRRSIKSLLSSIFVWGLANSPKFQKRYFIEKCQSYQCYYNWLAFLCSHSQLVKQDVSTYLAICLKYCWDILSWDSQLSVGAFLFWKYLFSLIEI